MERRNWAAECTSAQGSRAGGNGGGAGGGGGWGTRRPTVTGVIADTSA